VLESYTFDQKPPALNDSEFASFPRVPERPPFLPTDPNVEPVGVVVDEYFGKPRSSTNQEVSADPLEWMVEWELGAGATVGNTVAQLSEYIGYELLGADEIANKAYGRALPATYRRLQTTTVAQAFEILSGKGLMTVVNHADRTIKQLGSQTEAANDSLPLCPEEITLATISRVAASGDMVLMLPTGAECLFEQ